MVDAEQLWDDFIKRLNEVRPLGKRDEKIEHKAFIGSIEAYRKIFMDANRAHTASGRREAILDELTESAIEMIGFCQNEQELNDVKALLLGKGSLIKQLEAGLWAKK